MRLQKVARTFDLNQLRMAKQLASIGWNGTFLLHFQGATNKMIAGRYDTKAWESSSELAWSGTALGARASKADQVSVRCDTLGNATIL